MGGHDDIVAYYERTWFDYRALWLNSRNRAIHFGYWGEGVRSHDESLVAMNRLLADTAGIGPGDRVLDAGCGVGGSSFWLAESRGASVLGVTPVTDQVRRANRYVVERASGIDDRVAFVVGDYRAVPTAAGGFDVVWALESLCHAPDKDRFVAEAHRLLRPGGRVVIAEYLRARRPLDADGESLLGSWLTGWAIPDLLTGEELTAELERAGFVDVAVTDLTDAVRPSLRRLHRLASVLVPVNGALRRVRVRDGVQKGNETGARHQWRALQQGLWRYGLVTATKDLRG